MDKPPTSAGRVSGFGCNMKVAEYYSSEHSAGNTRKERRTASKDKAEVLELRAKVQSLEQEKVDLPTVNKRVNELVEEKLREFIPPGLLEGIAAWNAKGQKGPIQDRKSTRLNSSHAQ